VGWLNWIGPSVRVIQSIPALWITKFDAGFDISFIDAPSADNDIPLFKSTVLFLKKKNQYHFF
jgi:hypothetical protein